jgi:hypothetical protein
MNSEPPIPPTPPDNPALPPAEPPASYPPPAPQFSPPVAPAGPPPTGPAAEPLPFERPGAPFLESLLGTMKLVLLRPREAFTRMRVSGEYERPILFVFVLGILWILISSTYQFAFGGIWEHLREHLGHYRAVHIPPLARYLVSVVGSPFLVALGLAFATAFYHVFLMLFGASGGGLGATFRVLCYAEAAGVFCLVPGIGGLISFVWSLVVLIIGFAVVHRVSTGRTAAAVLTPTILCAACCASVVAMGLLARMLGGS